MHTTGSAAEHAQHSHSIKHSRIWQNIHHERPTTITTNIKPDTASAVMVCEQGMQECKCARLLYTHVNSILVAVWKTAQPPCTGAHTCSAWHLHVVPQPQHKNQTRVHRCVNQPTLCTKAIRLHQAPLPPTTGKHRTSTLNPPTPLAYKNSRSFPAAP